MQDQHSSSASIIGLEWHNGRECYSQAGMSAVAICLSNGSLQLMKDELDEGCMVISTGMQPSAIEWNSSGSVLAVTGVLSGGATSSGQGLAVVQFYSCTGESYSINMSISCTPECLNCPKRTENTLPAWRLQGTADSSTYTCAAVHQLGAVACLHHHAWKSCVDPTRL